MDRDVIVGTGCYEGNHITGVYVLPSFQKQGGGSQIMDCLESEIAKKHKTIHISTTDITYILTTHYHADHIGLVSELMKTDRISLPVKTAFRLS